MNPFGNIDEPEPPTWFREHWPRLPPRWLRFMWYVRNPLHNLCFVMWRRRVDMPIYVVGHSTPFANEVKQPFVLRFRPFFFKWPIPVPFRFFGWRSDKPSPAAMPQYGEGGGAFDLGWKKLG